jgi:hypothetical protein
LCSNQDPIPSRKYQNTLSKVVTVAPATALCCLTCPELLLYKWQHQPSSSSPRHFPPPLWFSVGAPSPPMAPSPRCLVPSIDEPATQAAPSFFLWLSVVHVMAGGRRRPPESMTGGPKARFEYTSCIFLCCVQKFISRVLELLKS